MKKFLSALILLMIFSSSAFGVSASELKLMSTFISNFTEVGMYDFEIDEISNSELIRFGIWHNWINNFKSRIQKCPDKNCPYGSFIIDKKYVSESVEKYFELEIEEHQSVEGNQNLGHYDGKKYYHFEGADGECVLAKVYDVEKNGKIIIMRGETYYPDHEDLEGKSFIATAKPYKYNGKNTWSILSLHVED